MSIFFKLFYYEISDIVNLFKIFLYIIIYKLFSKIKIRSSHYVSLYKYKISHYIIFINTYNSYEFFYRYLNIKKENESIIIFYVFMIWFMIAYIINNE